MARQLLVAELAPLLRIPGHSAAQLVAESRILVANLPRRSMRWRPATSPTGTPASVIDNANSLPAHARADFEAPSFRRRGVSTPRGSPTAPAAPASATTPNRRHRAATRTRPRAPRRSPSSPPAMGWHGSRSTHPPRRSSRSTTGSTGSPRPCGRPTTRAPSHSCAPTRSAISCCAARSQAYLPSGIRPQVLVTVPVLTLLELDDEPATLEGYGPIPGRPRPRLAAEAPSFVRLLTHPETGAVLSVGRDRYSVPADMRLLPARARRDLPRRRMRPSRRARATSTTATRGRTAASTSVDNLAHLCRGDHTRKHALGWKCTTFRAARSSGRRRSAARYLTEPSAVIRT